MRTQIAVADGGQAHDRVPKSVRYAYEQIVILVRRGQSFGIENESAEQSGRHHEEKNEQPQYGHTHLYARYNNLQARVIGEQAEQTKDSYDLHTLQYKAVYVDLEYEMNEKR